MSNMLNQNLRKMIIGWRIHNSKIKLLSPIYPKLVKYPNPQEANEY